MTNENKKWYEEHYGSKDYRSFVHRLSRRVDGGSVLSKDERKQLRSLGLEAKQVMQDVGVVLSQDDINRLLPPSALKSSRTLYLVRFEERERTAYAHHVALQYGRLNLPSDELAIGLTNEKQREAIDQAGIPYTRINRKI